MSTLTHLITQWNRPARKEPMPNTCAWTAACPHCTADADWHSTSARATTRYRMHCPQCGPVSWEVTR